MHNLDIKHLPGCISCIKDPLELQQLPTRRDCLLYSERLI